MNGKINIALSGGKTPELLFTVLSAEYKNKINWGKLFFYWVDERCVPPDSAESNFGMAEKNLLRNIAIPAENIYRISGEAAPEAEAVSYSEIIKRNIPSQNDFPVFDLIMLGVGEDGHTASIFPDQMNLLKSDKIAEVSKHPQSGQKRITLSGKVINNSDRIFFLASGKNKADVIANILEKKEDYLKYPAGHIETSDGGLKWYLDKEAASELKTL